jgi:DNA modification methylase
MDTHDHYLTDRYGLYLGDCVDIMHQLPDGCVDLSVYSPPFIMLYTYSSHPADLSNCLDKDEFWQHYTFVVQEISRLTKPGRMSAVHCTDIASGNSGLDHLYDFPGDIIRLHEQQGFEFVCRYHIWKEPLTVRNRTMTKSLSHKALTEDSTRCSIANADQLLIFRRSGHNAVAVEHPQGLTEYIGARHVPHDLLQYRYWTGNQIENKYSHWVWRQYASAFWDDVRLDRVLQFKEGRDDQDEKHCHALQLDVIERAITLWSNPNEIIFSPFCGIGSEIYGALSMGRRGIGIELKRSYFNQALRNIATVNARVAVQEDLFSTKMLFDIADQGEMAHGTSH